MPRWTAPWRQRRRGEFPITKRGMGSYAIAVRSSTEPAILGLRREQGSSGELGCRWQAVASGGASGHNLTPLVGRGAGGETTVARVGSPFRSRRGFVGQMGVKRPETGSKRRFLGEYATWPITAQLLFENRVMSRVAVHPSPERNRCNLIEHINLRRKHGAPNSGTHPANVAFCRMLAPAGWGVLYPDRRGASTADPNDSPSPRTGPTPQAGRGEPHEWGWPGGWGAPPPVLGCYGPERMRNSPNAEFGIWNEIRFVFHSAFRERTTIHPGAGMYVGDPLFDQ